MATQVNVKQMVVARPAAFGLPASLWLVGRFLIAFVVMLVAFAVSSAVIGVRMELAPEDESQAGLALLVVSFLNTLVLAYLIARSHWRGMKLIAAVFIVHAGVQTFMSQIETLFFIGAVQMPLDMVMRVIASGFLRAAIFAPLAVIVFGKLTGAQTSGGDNYLTLPKAEWAKRFVVLSLVYVVVYFLFGYYVAFQWVEARNYYAGTFSVDLVLPLFQVLRGFMWAALALPMVKMLNVKRWETGVAIGLVFAVLLATPILFPNAFMPPMVRQAHFFELTSSMLTYGIIAGWVWTGSTR